MQHTEQKWRLLFVDNVYFCIHVVKSALKLKLDLEQMVPEFNNMDVFESRQPLKGIFDLGFKERV